MDHWDDHQIVATVLAGDINAYSALVKRYQKPIFNLMYRMTRSHADSHDLSQETFIKAFEQLSRFNTSLRFFPWLYTIGLNHARNFVRRRKMFCTTSSEDFEESLTTENHSHQEEALCARLDLSHLQEALQQLPVDYREAIMLHFHEGFSMEEIASSLQLSVSGAKMRVHRGIKKLREKILGEDDGKPSIGLEGRRRDRSLES